MSPITTPPAAPAPPHGSPSAAPRPNGGHRLAKAAQQPELSLWAPVTITAQGGGDYLVRAAKPVEWLSVLQFGSAAGLSPSTVRRYIHLGIIPRDMLSAGRRKWRIRSEALARCREFALSLKLDGQCLCGASVEPGKIRCSPCDQAFSRLVSAPKSPGV